METELVYVITDLKGNVETALPIWDEEQLIPFIIRQDKQHYYALYSMTENDRQKLIEENDFEKVNCKLEYAWEV